MGYNTTFTGRVTIAPALNPHEVAYLRRFANVRHMHRTKGPYVVADGGYDGHDLASDVVGGGNEVQPGLPGPWCKWEPTEDGSAIEWNQEEKFYDAELWMAYLIKIFLEPGATAARELTNPVPGWVYPEELAHFTFDHIVDGVIDAEGEWPDDRWRIEVRDNNVYVIRFRVEPNFEDIDPRYPSEWGDDQWAEFEARTRNNIAFVVRDGRLREVEPTEGLVFAPVAAAR